MSDDALRKIAADATELLRLYDWRPELAKREAAAQLFQHAANTGMETTDEQWAEQRTRNAELSRDLRKYGREKKAAWEQLRTDLRELGERRPERRCTCNHTCPTKFERDTDDAVCVHAATCELLAAKPIARGEEMSDQIDVNAPPTFDAEQALRLAKYIEDCGGNADQIAVVTQTVVGVLRAAAAPVASLGASPSTRLPSGVGSQPSAGIRAEESADSPTYGASSVAGSGVSRSRNTCDTANLPIASPSTEPPKCAFVDRKGRVCGARYNEYRGDHVASYGHRFTSSASPSDPSGEGK